PRRERVISRLVVPGALAICRGQEQSGAPAPGQLPGAFGNRRASRGAQRATPAPPHCAIVHPLRPALAAGVLPQYSALGARADRADVLARRYPDAARGRSRRNGADGGLGGPLNLVQIEQRSAFRCGSRRKGRPLAQENRGQSPSARRRRAAAGTDRSDTAWRSSAAPGVSVAQKHTDLVADLVPSPREAEERAQDSINKSRRGEGTTSSPSPQPSPRCAGRGSTTLCRTIV